MSLETAARQSLYRQTQARGGDLDSLADRALLGRIWRYAGRHHRRLTVFLALLESGCRQARLGGRGYPFAWNGKMY